MWDSTVITRLYIVLYAHRNGGFVFWKVPLVYARPIAGFVFWKIRYHIPYVNTVYTACLSMEITCIVLALRYLFIVQPATLISR